MADRLGIRNYLTKEKGFTDADVTYNNGSVYLKNKHFADATPDADGSTYGSREGLNKAFNAYTNAGFQDKAQSILGQVEQRVNAPLPKFEAPKPFQYDRNTDPLYQNARQSAFMNAQTAGNNAMVATGARGIGNSSITTDRVAQIQQNEYGKLERDIAPQLYNQAFQKYLTEANLGRQAQMDNYNVSNDQLKNLSGLSSTYNNLYKQGVDEQYKADEWKMGLQDRNLKIASDFSKDYAVQVNPTEDPYQAFLQVQGLKPVAQRKLEEELEQMEYDRVLKEAGLTGIYNGNPTMAREQMNANNADRAAQRSIQQQNATTSANRASASKTSVPASQKPLSQTQINSTIDRLDKQFFTVNKDKTKTPKMEPLLMRQYIIDQNLSDEDTIKILNWYDLPVENPSQAQNGGLTINSGGR